MIIKSPAELRRLSRARSQPNVHFLRFPVLELLDAIRAEHFPHLKQRIDLLFVNRGPLACIDLQTDKSTHYPRPSDPQQPRHSAPGPQLCLQARADPGRHPPRDGRQAGDSASS